MASLQPLQPFAVFVDRHGILTRTGYEFLRGMFQRVGGSLDSLNAATLETHSWEAPGAIGGTTPNSAKFTLVEPGILKVDTSVAANSGGIKHVRQAITVPASSSAAVTVTWSVPFADNNYTVVATAADSTGATASLSVLHIESVAADKVIIRVNNTSGSSITGGLHVIAMHD